MIDKKKKYARSGFTLMELILALVFIGVVISLTTSLYVSSLEAQRHSYDEYDVQSKLRNMAMELNDVINNSKAIFTMPFYLPNDPTDPAVEDLLVANWDYYGLTEDGSELVKYYFKVAPDGTKQAVKEVLVSGNGVLFNLDFLLPTSSTISLGETFSQNLRYRIKVLKGGADDGFEIDTELDAKNANQVVFFDGGAAHSIAVRRAGNFDDLESVIFVHFIYDLSGSMNENIAVPGAGGGLVNRQKIECLREAMGKVVDSFRDEQNANVELLFYPYSTTANYYETTAGLWSPNSVRREDQSSESGKVTIRHPIYSGFMADGEAIRKYPSDAHHDISLKPIGESNDMYQHAVAEGSTNTGDALRRVYYNIKYIEDQCKEAEKADDALPETPSFAQQDAADKKWPLVQYRGKTRTHYVILLTDGMPMIGSIYQRDWHKGGYAYGEIGMDYMIFSDAGNFYSVQNDGWGWSKYEWPNVNVNSAEYAARLLPQKYSYNWSVVRNKYPAAVLQHWANKLDDEAFARSRMYIIGFSKDSDEMAAIDFIVDSCGIAPEEEDDKVFNFADDDYDLVEVLLDIKSKIISQQWIIMGPQKGK